MLCLKLVVFKLGRNSRRSSRTVMMSGEVIRGTEGLYKKTPK